MKKIFLLMSMFMAVMAGCAQKTDTFETFSGKKVVITPVKHGTLRITYNDNVEIDVDPVTALPPETDYSTFPKADIILVTHEHFDHCDKVAIEQLTKEGTRLIVNGRVGEILGCGEVMKNGDVAKYGDDITIEAVPAYNTSADKQQFHPQGRDNGYVLTIDGLRIYIAGDTEVIPEMGQMTHIDIAFLPTNLPFTMTPEQTATAAKLIQPSVLFPYHYGETKIERVKELLEGTDIDVRIRNYQ